MNRTVLIIVVLLLCPVAWAEEDTLQMVGEARLKFLFWPIYDSRLYSLDGSFQDGQRPLRFEIQYLRDVSAPDLVVRTRDEWQRLQPVSAPEEQWLQALSRLWPDVSENDVLALALDEQGGSTFLLNGQPLGEIGDPAFGERFLSIWLSPGTSRPDLRLGLLGSN